MMVGGALKRIVGRERIYAAAAVVGLSFLPVRPLYAQPAVDGAGTPTVPRTLQDIMSLQPEVTINGRVRSNTAGGLSLVLDSKVPIRLPIAPPSVIPPGVAGVPLSVQVRRQDDQLKITSATLPAIDQWRRVRSELSQKHPQLVAPFEQLERRSDRILPQNFLRGESTVRPDLAPEAQFKAFNEEAIVAENAIIEAFLSLDAADAEGRSRLIDLFSTTLRTRKAIYGRSDLYRPMIYQMIRDASRGSVAIVEKNPDRVRCSGVLVGQNIVLTALHCLNGVIVSAEIKVWFNFEKDLAEPPHNLPVTSYSVDQLLVQGSTLPHPEAGRMDYALLRLSQTDGRDAGQTFTARCLSRERVRYDQALYVVGHPLGAERTVHDNGWAIFPFLVTREEFGRLLMLVETEFKDSPDHNAAIANFRESYVKSTDGGQELYRNFSARWNFQPTIGVEIDTFHGNSGGPVFGRIDQNVVGIVIDGEPDDAGPWVPGWRRHEAVLPASEILADIEAQRPELINADIQVCTPQ